MLKGEIIPKGSSKGVQQNRINGFQLFGRFLADSYPLLNFKRDIKIIATIQIMQQFAFFCVLAKKKNMEMYSFKVMEVYFNAAVLQVEDEAGIKFDDAWQMRVVEEMVKAIIKRQMEGGEEHSVKVSVGRRTLSKISHALYLQNTVSSIEIRASIITELKAAGR